MYANSHEAAHTGKGSWAGGFTGRGCLDMGVVCTQADSTTLGKIHPKSFSSRATVLIDACGDFEQS